jgi:cation diffusion facilitator CzcD-associated flavoprotein CzcO
MLKVAVIGAGAAGLCAAKHLKAQGVAVTIFEMGSHIGGLWVYENDNGLSPAYQSLHVNSENRVTAYVDFPFPVDAPLYPDHRQMTAYLCAYAEHFDLVKHIRFQSPIEAVQADPGHGGPSWYVTVRGQDKERFDAVVVASGHQGVPLHPPFAKDFSGQYLHSHQYRVPEPFKGQRVLVVGIGNSACDIAADVCTQAQSTVIAARSSVLLMPRMFLGVPTSRVLAKVEKPWVPWPVRRFFRTLVSRMAHGTMEQWGFRTPTKRTHPAGHHLLMGHFVWGRIKAKPGIAAIQGHDVRFDDGTVQAFDSIIAATGYRVDLPFLRPETSPVEGHWLRLFHRVVHPQQPGLYFMGFFNVSGGGNIRMMDDQAQWIAALVNGRCGLPSVGEMNRAIDQERITIQKLYPDSPRYGLELDPVAYRQALARVQRMAKSL